MVLEPADQRDWPLDASAEVEQAFLLHAVADDFAAESLVRKVLSLEQDPHPSHRLLKRQPFVLDYVLDCVHEESTALLQAATTLPQSVLAKVSTQV
jgi:hypothetical protein